MVSKKQQSSNSSLAGGLGHKFVIPTRLYRIGDLVRHTPFSRQTIHNYTTMGLIRESQWTDGGHRLYDESVFEQLSKITEFKKSKTLSEIRKILGSEDEFTKSKNENLKYENN